MSAFLLHVSLPDRTDLAWSIPEVAQGQSAHYLYDISLPGRKGLQPGSKIFLWGTKRVGKHGLFACGICEKPDDVAVKSDKDFDAFVLVKHDRVLDRAIPPEDLQRDKILLPLVRKIESSTLLEIFPLDNDQARSLDQALSAWGAVRGRQGVAAKEQV
jgi:hypothetical protein